MKIPKLILSRPKLVVDVKCPKCSSLDIVAFTKVDLTCKNCKTKFETNAEINIYYSIAKKLLQLISHHNEVHINGVRDNAEVFYPEDLLKPRSKFEDDIYHTMLAIKHNFEDQKCYEVSEITNEIDEDYKIRCKKCGYCNNCITCSNCGEHYVPKHVDTRIGKQQRYKCPKCSSRSYKKTYIKKLSKECPYCKSKNVRKTHFYANNKQCPYCKSKDVSKPRTIPIYKLIIKRQKRNIIPED